jgi:hypothetical protein
LEEAMATALELEMSAFLNRYNETFATWDGDKIAEFYCVPTITMRGDGSIHCFLSREEIVRFFRGVADTYKGEATTGARATDLVAVPLGERSALATVTWTNLEPMEAWQGSFGSRTMSFALPKAGASWLRRFT